MAAITPGPWKACRTHEDFDGPHFDIDAEDRAEYEARPFVRICARGHNVTTNHDLFEFRNPADALAIAAVPDLLAAARDVIPDLQLFVSKQGPGPDRRLAALVAALTKAGQL